LILEEILKEWKEEVQEDFRWNVNELKLKPTEPVHNVVISFPTKKLISEEELNKQHEIQKIEEEKRQNVIAEESKKEEKRMKFEERNSSIRDIQFDKKPKEMKRRAFDLLEDGSKFKVIKYFPDGKFHKTNLIILTFSHPLVIKGQSIDSLVYRITILYLLLIELETINKSRTIRKRNLVFEFSR